MRKFLIAGAVVLFILVILIIGGFFDGFKQGFVEGMAEGFHDEFKSSFMESCIGSDYSSQKKLFCECITNEVLEKFSIEQMKDTEAMKKHIESEIVPGCEEKILGQ